VVAEDLRGDIRLLAEGQVALHQRVDNVRTELKSDIAALDRRVMRLEVTRG
jgi:ubiquinone biosynthesis protein UbiJ